MPYYQRVTLLRGYEILLRLYIVLVLFYFTPYFGHNVLFLFYGGRGPPQATWIYIYVQVHTRGFFDLAVVYLEALNKCDHKLAIHKKSSPRVLT